MLHTDQDMDASVLLYLSTDNLLTFKWRCYIVYFPVICSNCLIMITGCFIHRVKWEDVLKLNPVFSFRWASLHVTFTYSWLYCQICGHNKSQLDVSWCSPCDVHHLVHITHGALCLASEICQRGGAEAARVSHVSLRKTVVPDVKEHVRGCHVTDTF